MIEAMAVWSKIASGYGAVTRYNNSGSNSLVVFRRAHGSARSAQSAITLKPYDYRIDEQILVP